MATPGRPPILLVAGFLLFAVTLGYLVLSSLTRRAAPVFDPTPVGRVGGLPVDRPDTMTIDAGDENLWRFADLDEGVVLALGDSAGWDLAIQRFRLRGAATVENLGVAPFPTSLSEATSLFEEQGVANADGFGRWYKYSMLSHLLTPTANLYRVRTDRAGTVLLQILSYYCPGLDAGCLTFRYLAKPPDPDDPRSPG